MVICIYFQTGSCRFGTKCDNEHFDVRQVVKTDVESAVNGKQWPLSCFSPFKEKPNLPDFIADLSFEEVRWSIYESRNTPSFPMVQRQFEQQVLEAQNKMKALLTLNSQIIDVIINLYNKPETILQVSSNPFSVSASAANDRQQTASNIFGNNSVQQSDSYANNNNFTSSSNIFSQSAFGGGNTAFGAPKASIFGAAANTTVGAAPVGGGNVFSLNQIGPQQNAPAAGGNIFATAAQTQQVSQQQPVSNFGNTSIFSTNSGQQGNIFAQANNILQQQQSIQHASQEENMHSVFGQNNHQQPNSFGLPQIHQEQLPSNAFSSLQQTQVGAASVFGLSQSQPSASNIFGQPSNQQNTFTQPQQSQQPVGNFGGSQQPNVFGSSPLQQQQVTSLPFGGPTNQNQHAPNAFGAPNSYQQNSAFGASNETPATSEIIAESVYSKMDQLSPEYLEAFRSNHFVMGRIPNVPPPKELCN